MKTTLLSSAATVCACFLLLPLHLRAQHSAPAGTGEKASTSAISQPVKQGATALPEAEERSINEQILAARSWFTPREAQMGRGAGWSAVCAAQQMEIHADARGVALLLARTADEDLTARTEPGFVMELGGSRGGRSTGGTLGSATTQAQIVFENNDQLPGNLTLTIAQPASIVQLADRTETIASLVMTGGLINISTGNLTLTGGVTTPAGFTGRVTHTGLTSHLWNIADGAAVPDAQVNAIVTVPEGSFLDKTGPGRADFTASNNLPVFYVSGGTLNVTGSNPDTDVQLAGGTLGGTGSVSAITGDGGTVTSGLSLGRLISKGATLSGGDTLQMELNGPDPAIGYDQLTLLGAWSIEGATLALTVGFAPVPGTQFLIINSPGSGSGGGFAGLPEGAIINSGLAAFRINYQTSSVTLTALAPIPPPHITSFAFSPGTGPGGQDQVTRAGTAAPSAVLSLEASTDLDDWTTLQSVTATAAGEVSVTVNQTPGLPKRFFLLRP